MPKTNQHEDLRHHRQGLGLVETVESVEIVEIVTQPDEISSLARAALYQLRDLACFGMPDTKRAVIGSLVEAALAQGRAEGVREIAALAQGILGTPK